MPRLLITAERRDGNECFKFMPLLIGYQLPLVFHQYYSDSLNDVHTNSVEGIWSLLKRSIIGSYHKVSV